MSKHLPCQEGQLVQVLPLVLGQARHSTRSTSVIAQITTISMYPFFLALLIFLIKQQKHNTVPSPSGFSKSQDHPKPIGSQQLFWTMAHKNNLETHATKGTADNHNVPFFQRKYIFITIENLSIIMLEVHMNRNLGELIKRYSQGNKTQVIEAAMLQPLSAPGSLFKDGFA
jgi:hypothetical protein